MSCVAFLIVRLAPWLAAACAVQHVTPDEGPVVRREDTSKSTPFFFDAASEQDEDGDGIANIALSALSEQDEVDEDDDGMIDQQPGVSNANIALSELSEQDEDEEDEDDDGMIDQQPGVSNANIALSELSEQDEDEEDEDDDGMIDQQPGVSNVNIALSELSEQDEDDARGDQQLDATWVMRRRRTGVTYPRPRVPDMPYERYTQWVVNPGAFGPTRTGSLLLEKYVQDAGQTLVRFTKGEGELACEDQATEFSCESWDLSSPYQVCVTGTTSEGKKTKPSTASMRICSEETGQIRMTMWSGSRCSADIAAKVDISMSDLQWSGIWAQYCIVASSEYSVAAFGIEMQGKKMNKCSAGFENKRMFSGAIR